MGGCWIAVIDGGPDCQAAQPLVGNSIQANVRLKVESKVDIDSRSRLTFRWERVVDFSFGLEAKR